MPTEECRDGDAILRPHGLTFARSEASHRNLIETGVMMPNSSSASRTAASLGDSPSEALPAIMIWDGALSKRINGLTKWALGYPA